MSPSSSPGSVLPTLPTITEIQHRLGEIFPESFPNRGILVGTMAARVVFVFLYGSFIEGAQRYLRPSYIYLFTDEQATKTSDVERGEWAAAAPRPGFRPEGRRWYADNSRETIRDDLMRNQLSRLGLAHKLAGIPTTASTPAWYLDAGFVALFNPVLSGPTLYAEVTAWQGRALDAGTRQRMALRAAGAHRREGDVYIDMPDGSRMRISAGPSSLIAKALIEEFAPRYMRNPLVVWLSASDTKSYPQFVALAETVGLSFDVSAELPDVILAELGGPVHFVFCEIVATDGAVTEARKRALLELVRASSVPWKHVAFLTAFDDREAGPFRKNFSALATGSMVWFRTEPDLLVTLKSASGD